MLGTAIEVQFCKESGPLGCAWQVAINGRRFHERGIESGFGVEVCEISNSNSVRARINETLRFCADDGRVVMLGRDIASTWFFPPRDLPSSLMRPTHVRERRQQSSRGWTDAIARDKRDAHCISIRQGNDGD